MISLWWIDLDDSRALQCDVARELSIAERERAEQFRFDAHRDRWLAGRLALRRILARELGVVPRGLAFDTLAHGKPILTSEYAATLEFNMSHSLSCALVGVMRGAALGVDVEAVERIADIHAIAERNFAEEERAQLFALADAEQAEGFYRIWTRKEAYIKAIGSGLGHALNRFAVTIEADPCAFIHLDGDRSAADRWSLLHVEPPHGSAAFVGAVAAPRANERVENRVFDWTE